MGKGKTIKYPKRQKYRAPIRRNNESEQKPISEEEHKKRLEMLKKMGILKR